MGLLVISSTGCQSATHEDKGVTMELNPSILVEDQAMQHRDWQRSALVYQNTSTLAGPTARVWTTTDTQGANAVTDIVVFSGNVIFGPFTYLTVPPWTPIYYRAVNVPPSYTAVPPVPGASDPD
jgi:hypothetical protein